MGPACHENVTRTELKLPLNLLVLARVQRNLEPRAAPDAPFWPLFLCLVEGGAFRENNFAVIAAWHTQTSLKGSIAGCGKSKSEWSNSTSEHGRGKAAGQPGDGYLNLLALLRGQIRLQRHEQKFADFAGT
jgi:hypothetical protein